VSVVFVGSCAVLWVCIWVCVMQLCPFVILSVGVVCPRCPHSSFCSGYGRFFFVERVCFWHLWDSWVERGCFSWFACCLLCLYWFGLVCPCLVMCFLSDACFLLFVVGFLLNACCLVFFRFLSWWACLLLVVVFFLFSFLSADFVGFVVPNVSQSV